MTSNAATILVQFRPRGLGAFSAEYADHLSDVGMELLVSESIGVGTELDIRLTPLDGGGLIDLVGRVTQEVSGRVRVHLAPAKSDTHDRYLNLIGKLVTRDIPTEDLIYND